MMLASHATAGAQSGPAAPDPLPVYTRETDGRVVIRATRTRQPPRIDGRLDDTAYREVPAFSGFIQADPAEGEPETEKTEAYVFFDDRHVYMAVRGWDAAAAGIVATEMRRDHNRINQNDHVSISFDTFYDGRSGFQFTLTAAGGLQDGTIVDEGLQADWNGIYEARASRDDQGWSAEHAIPVGVGTIFRTRGSPTRPAGSAGSPARWPWRLAASTAATGPPEPGVIVKVNRMFRW
jgi:hypothetical protein